MSAFVDSVKQIFSSVFGRGDIVHLLKDDFDIDPTMNPATAPGALHRKAEAARPSPAQRKGGARQAPPTSLSPSRVAERMAGDTFGGENSFDLPEAEDFDWSAEFGPDDPPASAPAALDILLGPAGVDAMAETGSPVLRLVRQAGPELGGEAVAMAGTILDSGAVPPTLGTGEVLAATVGMFGLGESLQTSQAGPPPSTLWDETEVKLELLDQLDRERLTPPLDLDPVQWSRAVDRLGLALSRLDRELPPLPVAASRLLADKGADDEAVIEAIRADPALAGAVVKAANSPFFMAAVPASSLQGALVRLGVEEARRVAVGAAFQGAFVIAGAEVAMARMRTHALATAIACEILGRSAKEVDSGQAFLAGLLHDAGELLVRRLLLSGPDDGPLAEDVVDRLALRVHQRVGALLFGGWDLDANIAATLAWHHAPEEAEVRFRPLCHVVHVADLLAEIAVSHASSPRWGDALVLYADRDDAGARERAVATDGVEELDLGEVLAFVPRGFGADRLRGVVRGVLLRMESEPAH